jgi:hypothetical protein
MNVLTVQWTASTYSLLCCLPVTIRGLVGPSRLETSALVRTTASLLYPHPPGLSEPEQSLVPTWVVGTKTNFMGYPSNPCLSYPVYERNVDSSPLGFSLSSHRHSYIGGSTRRGGATPEALPHHDRRCQELDPRWRCHRVRLCRGPVVCRHRHLAARREAVMQLWLSFRVSESGGSVPS